MMTNPYTHKQPTERKYTIRGRVGENPVSISVSGLNVMDVMEKIKSQYPTIEVIAIHLEKG